MAKATVFNPKTGERKAVEVGDPNAFKGGFVLENEANKAQNGMGQPQTYIDYINQAFKNPDYQKAVEQYNTLQEQAPNFLANKSAELQSKDPALKQLLQERGKFTSQLYSEPFAKRDALRDIFDPIKRDALIAQSVGNVLGQLNTTQGFVESRKGTLDQQAERAANIFNAQLESAGENVQSQQKLLQAIADKNYAEARKELDRQQEMEDYFTKYTGKLEIDRSLGIGDFKPAKAPSAPKPTETEKQMGAYASLRGQYEDGYLKYLSNQSTQYGMSLDPNSPDVRASYEATKNQLTPGQQDTEDFQQSLRDAIGDIDNGADKDDVQSQLLRLFPDKANAIESTFSLL